MRGRIIAAASAIACCSAAAAMASGPSAQTQATTDITAASGTLHGVVNPDDKPTTYWFELGTTTAYGAVTSPTSMAKTKTPTPVAETVAGLQPGTAYHARVVAKIDKATIKGADVTFTTAAVAQDTGAQPQESVPTVPAAQATTPSLAPAATPELGHSIAVTRANGEVVVRIPGTAAPALLRNVASVPVDSIVDTRRGSVDLTTQLPGGATQTGSFHGGVFQVRQAAGANGLTELVLRGAAPTCSRARARAAATVVKHPPRVLWGHDSHGRFRTRASNAVITVRGTTWYVADRCDGTLTRVTKGSVAVRDLHRHRTVVVRAGHRYLAKAR
jgi:hypothetical protein